MNPTPLTLTRSCASLIAVVGALLAMPPAHAQSSYSMTVLSVPSGAYRYYPTALLNNDTVKGGMSYFHSLGWIPAYYCMPCSTYLDREVTWPTSTAKSVGATLGLRGFFPLLANDAGQQVGSYTLNPTTSQSRFLPTALWATRSGSVTGRKATHLLNNASSSPMQLPNQGALAWAQAYGLNDLGWLVGSKDPGGYLYRNGVFESVPLNYPVALNRQGDIVGSVVVADNPLAPLEEQTWSGYPVILRSGQTMQVGGINLRHYGPVDINVTGQVLLQEEQPDYPNEHTRSAVWDGQTVTAITGPGGLRVQAVDINDSGTVVCCKTWAPC